MQKGQTPVFHACKSFYMWSVCIFILKAAYNIKINKMGHLPHVIGNIHQARNKWLQLIGVDYYLFWQVYILEIEYSTLTKEEYVLLDD